MKLKKIASLALAGVMAVSMLAGCAGKTGTTDDNGTTVVVTGSNAAVEAFNKAQDTVEFASDVTLQSALEQATKAVGTKNSGLTTLTGGTKKDGATYVYDYILMATGETFVQDLNALDADKNGKALVVVRSDSSDMWSETAAIANAVNELMDDVDGLKTTTYDKANSAAESKYYDYTYTGKVAMASATDATGETAYYVACVITRTAAEKTYSNQ